MKNKLKHLFEDYLYSDHVYNGLFKEPKEDIINLLTNIRTNKKNEIKYFIDIFIKK